MCRFSFSLLTCLDSNSGFGNQSTENSQKLKIGVCLFGKAAFIKPIDTQGADDLLSIFNRNTKKGSLLF